MFPFVTPMNIHPPSAVAGGCPGFIYNKTDHNDYKDDWTFYKLQASGDIVANKTSSLYSSWELTQQGPYEIIWVTETSYSLSDVQSIRVLTNVVALDDVTIGVGISTVSSSSSWSSATATTTSNLTTGNKTTSLNVSAQTSSFYIVVRFFGPEISELSDGEIREVELICAEEEEEEDD